MWQCTQRVEGIRVTRDGRDASVRAHLHPSFHPHFNISYAKSHQALFIYYKSWHISVASAPLSSSREESQATLGRQSKGHVSLLLLHPSSILSS